MSVTNPVPGYAVTTPYRVTGPFWRACGWHTGVDIAAPDGATVVAARPGVVHHTDYGSAFGPYQFALRTADGGEDFYAHTTSRPAHGAHVVRGQPVAKVGALGAATGPHLHFERHHTAGVWKCSNMRDPAASINEEDTMLEYWYGGKPSGTLLVGRKYTTLDQSKWDPKNKGLQLSLVYLNVSAPKLLPGKPGALRVRMVRADSDKSGYHDYPITGLDTQLITHTYFELGNGEPIFWQVKCVGGLVACTIGTRYTKGSVT